MQFTKIAFLAIGLLFTASQASAQKGAKLEEKAKKQVEDLNLSLSTVDKALALTPEQMTAAQVIYLAGETEMAEARKTATTDEAKKEKLQPIRKEMNKKIKTEVLSKEQAKAIAKPKKQE